MKRLKWLLELADTKPLLFSIALLLIAIGVLAAVITNRDNNIKKCEQEKRDLGKYYEKRVDSLIVDYRLREIELNEEVKKTLNSVIDGYREQVEEQKRLNSKVSSTLSDNQRIINKNRSKLKNSSR